MVLFFTLHPMEFIFLNSSDLHLAMLQTSQNKLLTEKLLKLGYWYHKLCKTFFLNFISHTMILNLMSMSVLNPLCQGLSEPENMVTLCIN